MSPKGLLRADLWALKEESISAKSDSKQEGNFA